MLIDKLWQVNIVTRDSSGNILTTTDYSGDVVAGDVSLDYQLNEETLTVQTSISSELEVYGDLFMYLEQELVNGTAEKVEVQMIHESTRFTFFRIITRYSIAAYQPKSCRMEVELLKDKEDLSFLFQKPMYWDADDYDDTFWDTYKFSSNTDPSARSIRFAKNDFTTGTVDTFVWGIDTWLGWAATQAGLTGGVEMDTIFTDQVNFPYYRNAVVPRGRSVFKNLNPSLSTSETGFFGIRMTTIQFLEDISPVFNCKARVKGNKLHFKRRDRFTEASYLTLLGNLETLCDNGELSNIPSFKYNADKLFAGGNYKYRLENDTEKYGRRRHEDRVEWNPEALLARTGQNEVQFGIGLSRFKDDGLNEEDWDTSHERRFLCPNDAQYIHVHILDDRVTITNQHNQPANTNFTVLYEPLDNLGNPLEDEDGNVQKYYNYPMFVDQDAYNAGDFTELYGTFHKIDNPTDPDYLPLGDWDVNDFSLLLTAERLQLIEDEGTDVYFTTDAFPGGRVVPNKIEINFESCEIKFIDCKVYI
jgi:hypothetical protein